MSRTKLSLFLGGAMVLIAAACGPKPTSETPASVESQAAESSDVGNVEAQSPEIYDKPVVTVSRSPT